MLTESEVLEPVKVLLQVVPATEAVERAVTLESLSADLSAAAAMILCN